MTPSLYRSPPVPTRGCITLDNIILIEALGIVVCLLASAFFSGSETALTSLSTAQAQKLYEQHNAKSLKLWLEHPIQVLTAILIGNNIFNVTASALTTDLAQRLLGQTSAKEWAIPVAIAFTTILLLIFGEITPKAIAKKMYRKVAPLAITGLRLPYFLFKPLTIVFTYLTRRTMQAMGNDPNEITPYVTAEEIEYMIDLGSREGTFPEDHERMLRSVFEFKDTLVREIMIPRTDMVVLSNLQTLDDIVATFVRCGHSRLPVYEGQVDNIIGIFYAKDILEHFFIDRENGPPIHSIMRKPFFVPGSKPVSDLLEEFQRQRIHMAIVIDEFGGTDGLVTFEDIIEEFFGEIQDEYDTEPDQLTHLESGGIRADGRLSTWDIEEHFDVSFPEDADYETLGGFILSEHGAVPVPGAEIAWHGLMFTVLEADEKRVGTVRIERMPEAQHDDSGD